MIGTINFIREKEGTRGKYLTLALEDGTKGLVVNDEKIMEVVKEGKTYDFTVEKSGIFTIVTGIASASEQSEPEKLPPSNKPSQTKSKKSQYNVGSPPGGKYQGEYYKRKHPDENATIALLAVSKSLIEAYSRLWIDKEGLFDNLDELNTRIMEDSIEYFKWLSDAIKDLK